MKSPKNRGNIFFKKFLQKQPGKVFPRMARPIPKGIDEKPKNRGNIFFKKFLQKQPWKFFRGWPVRFQKESTKSRKNRGNIFFKKFLQKQPEKVFPRMACPIPKGIDEKSEKTRFFFQFFFKNSPEKFFRGRPIRFLFFALSYRDCRNLVLIASYPIKLCASQMKTGIQNKN